MAEVLTALSPERIAQLKRQACDRVDALGDFRTLSADRARDLAARYGLDYLITDGQLALPVAFESGTLRIYRLR